MSARCIHWLNASNKSSIIELCDWLDENKEIGNPFIGAMRKEFKASMNYNSHYTDMMFYNVAWLKQKSVGFMLFPTLFCFIMLRDLQFNNPLELWFCPIFSGFWTFRIGLGGFLDLRIIHSTTAGDSYSASASPTTANPAKPRPKTGHPQNVAFILKDQPDAIKPRDNYST